MIEKLKLYVWLPILAICGWVYYLVTRNDSLQQQVQQLKMDAAFAQTKDKLMEAGKEADDAEKRYRDTAARYRDEHGSGD